jgi:hypothetical protein
LCPAGRSAAVSSKISCVKKLILNRFLEQAIPVHTNVVLCLYKEYYEES